MHVQENKYKELFFIQQSMYTSPLRGLSKIANFGKIGLFSSLEIAIRV